MADYVIPRQKITLFQFDDAVLPFTMDAVGDISADTFEFILSTSANALVFKVDTAGGGITITSNGSVSTAGAIEVSLVDQLERAVGDYKFELRRTNDGAEKVLAYGAFQLKQARRDAA